MNWLIFALMTVLSWGLYGIFLHSGQVGHGGQVQRPLQSLPLRRPGLFPDRRPGAAGHSGHAQGGLESFPPRGWVGRWWPALSAPSARFVCCWPSAMAASPAWSCPSFLPARPSSTRVVAICLNPPQGRPGRPFPGSSIWASSMAADRRLFGDVLQARRPRPRLPAGRRSRRGRRLQARAASRATKWRASFPPARPSPPNNWPNCAGLLAAILPANRFYRQKLAGLDTRLSSLDDFRRFPFTTKAELSADQRAFPLTAPTSTCPLAACTRFHQTSGTDQRPVALAGHPGKLAIHGGKLEKNLPRSPASAPATAFISPSPSAPSSVSGWPLTPPSNWAASACPAAA